MPAEPVEKIDEVRGEADADRHVANGVFEDQVPADDPRDELAHGRVGVGVRAASDRNHGREFGVAERGEGAHDRNQGPATALTRGRRRGVRGWLSDG